MWVKDPNIAGAVVVLGGIAIAELYASHTPSLATLRAAPQGDLKCRQGLLDGEMLVGSLAGLGAVAVGVSAKSVGAGTAFFAVFVAMSYWHHNVLNSPQV